MTTTAESPVHLTIPTLSGSRPTAKDGTILLTRRDAKDTARAVNRWVLASGPRLVDYDVATPPIPSYLDGERHRIGWVLRVFEREILAQASNGEDNGWYYCRICNDHECETHCRLPHGHIPGEHGVVGLRDFIGDAVLEGQTIGVWVAVRLDEPTVLRYIGVPRPAATERKVHQPRQMVFPQSPTFQEYVNRSDAPRNPATSSYLPIGFLRDEYISTYGTDHGGVWL